MLEKPDDFTVSELDIKENGVQAVLGDVLYGEPDDNKKIFDRLVTFLIEKYNAVTLWLVDKAHIHSNKELLDTVVDENVHAHTNKEIIDTIQEANVHAHDNKSILDTIAEQNVHEHQNKTTIDKITQARMNAWDLSAGIPGGKIIDIATEEQALHGIDNETVMTPKRVKDLYYQKTEVNTAISTAIEESITSVLEGEY